MRRTAIRFTAQYGARFLRAAALIVTLGCFASAGAGAQTITFTTQPYDATAASAASGVAGTAYSYDADATASNGGTIKYLLRYGPAGMTVNLNTGAVAWMPPREGTYLVEIRAELANNPSVDAVQRWSILVTECNGNAIIIGSVKDENGNPVQSGTVTAQMVGPTHSPLTKVVVPINNGEYGITVDRGTYALRVDARDFISEWYNDAYTFGAATYVTTTCGSTITANFNVMELFPAVTGNINGKVVDVGENVPMEGARTGVCEIPRVLWETSDKQWRLRLEASGGVPVRSTEADGSYSARGLFGNMVYIPCMHLKESGDLDIGFIRQFNGYTPNVLEAEPIIFTGDTHVEVTDANFAVRMPDGPRHMIVEAVDNQNEEKLVKASIVAYAVQSTPQGIKVDPTRSLGILDPMSTSGTRLNHPHLAPYIILAIPFDTNYVPGFYRENQVAALLPGNATIANITDADMIPEFTIRLRRKPPVPGASDLRGTVHGTINGNEKEGATPQSVSTLPGAFVYALDSADNVVSYTYTNVDGSYLLDGLPGGNLTVHAGRIGYDEALPQTIRTSGTGEIMKADFSLAGGVASVPGSPVSNAVPATVQPNPASETATIGFEGKAGKAHFTLTATDGRRMLTREIETMNGENAMDLNVSELPGGTYIGTITGEGYTATVRVTIAR